MDYSPYKDALLRKRGEILSVGGGVNRCRPRLKSIRGRAILPIRPAATTKCTFSSSSNRPTRNPSGDRRGSLPDGGGASTAFVATAANRSPPPGSTPSRGRASASPVRKNKARERHPISRLPPRFLPRQDDDAAAPRRCGAPGQRLRLQQYLPVRDRARGRAAQLAARRDHRHGGSADGVAEPAHQRSGKAAEQAAMIQEDRDVTRNASSTSGGRGSRRCPTHGIGACCG